MRRGYNIFSQWDFAFVENDFNFTGAKSRYFLFPEGAYGGISFAGTV